jgi:hypothetical protein
MSSSAIGPEFNDLQPPKPLHILLRAGQPCDEVILAPEPAPLTPKDAQKAKTRARLTKETAKALSAVQDTLSMYGVEGKPDGKYVPPEGNWVSHRPDHNLTIACAGGAFGETRTELKPRKIANPIKANRARKAREAEGFDVAGFKAAQAVAERWQFMPWKGCLSSSGDQVFVETSTESGHWEPVAASYNVVTAADTPEAVAPAVSEHIHTALVNKSMTADGLNSAYEAYSLNPKAELVNLKVALYAFAPKNGRWEQCDVLLQQGESSLVPDDIIGDFAADLLDRFEKGQYRQHDRRMHHWVSVIWARWFFPGVKTEFYKEASLTIRVNESDFDYEAEESEERVQGELYRDEVDWEMARRAKTSCNDATERASRVLRDLNDPATEFGRLDDDTKAMIRAMAKGMTKAEAAESVGLSQRQGRRKLKTVAGMREHSFISHLFGVSQ